MFGPHLIIDGSGCNRKKLADRNLIERVLNSYPSAIGMTKIGGPHIFEYQAPDPAYSGISGIVIIAESHIAIHTFPELDYFTLDVFSCRDFDPEVAVDYIQQAFEVKQMDRIVLQRGLSFHAPHHGHFAAPSSDTRTSAHDHTLAELAQSEKDLQRPTSWPRYGYTPDYGSYGESAPEKLLLRTQGTAVLGAAAPSSIDAIQINPNASISGLLDAMSAAGGQARLLGRGLEIWERLVREPEATIVLALSTPVIPNGLREVLVSAIERHYFDGIVLSAEELFADLYEALGFSWDASPEISGVLVTSPEGRKAASRLFTKFVAHLGPDECLNSADVWQRLGLSLVSVAPRMSVLQAAAVSGVRIFTPDLSTSTFGKTLLGLSGRGVPVHVPMDVTQDIPGLSHLLAALPRLGIIRAGTGVADPLIDQAYKMALALTEPAPELCASVSLLAANPLAEGGQHIAISAPAELIIPLLVTALAQRVPHRAQAPVYAH
ncbi:MAG: adenosylmethionine decarboxylase [Ktedonobacterales bacterium]